MEEIDVIDMMGAPIMEGHSFAAMLLRFVFNTVAVWIMIHCLYYPRSRRRDFYFTFMMISVSVFFLIYLLGGVKIKIGFALGLFAIFGIIRYRTEQLPVREMTYLFVIIAMSVINGLSTTVHYAYLIATNAIFIVATWFFERCFLVRHVSTKIVQYDRIALITPDKREELIADLRQRTGLHITGVEVGAIDFLRDMAIVKIYYEADKEEDRLINHTFRVTRDEWTEQDK